MGSDGWDEPGARGVLGWQTLITGDQTPSESLNAGIAIFEQGGFLALHRLKSTLKAQAS